MSDFTLQCWVPSISAYSRVYEFTVGQYTTLSKFILNNDDEGLAEYFETILQNNLKEKNLYKNLTKYDKWFLLTFLRTVNISPTLTLKAKDPANKECTYDIDLLKILTQGSDFFPIYKFNIQMDLINVEIEIDNSIKLKNKPILNYIKTIQTKKNKIQIHSLPDNEKNSIFKNLGIIENVIENIVFKKDELNKVFKIIPVIPQLKEVYEVSLSLFDNTLFEFLKLIFSPYSKGIFAKKYFLMNKIGVNLSHIDSLTPLECDIYINLYNQENTAKIKGNQSLT